MSGIITFTTDFGLKDAYVGAMKGAALSINPLSRFVDISHGVTPGNIMEGAFILLQSYSFFPKGTIHVAVVDPGVGGRRKAVLVETDRYIFVGPDNGLLSLAAGRENVRRVVHLTERPFFRREVSSTFHGRDIFAPVAAHLSLGTNPGAFGLELDTLSPLKMPKPAEKGGAIKGEVIYVDTFGNLVTNIMGKDISGRTADMKVTVNGSAAGGFAVSYSAVKKGEALAVIGSAGYLEIAVNMGSASAKFSSGVGDKVGCVFSASKKTP